MSVENLGVIAVPSGHMAFPRMLLENLGVIAVPSGHMAFPRMLR